MNMALGAYRPYPPDKFSDPLAGTLTVRRAQVGSDRNGVGSGKCGNRREINIDRHRNRPGIGTEPLHVFGNTVRWRPLIDAMDIKYYIVLAKRQEVAAYLQIHLPVFL